MRSANVWLIKKGAAMHRLKLNFSLFLIHIFFINNVFAGEIKDQTHCDLVGTNVLVLKNLTNYSECNLECAKNKKCQGYVFISHWNRCFLKSSIKRQVQLNMISGLPGLAPKLDHDHSGKDLRQVTTKDAVGCDSQCSKDAACGAYTFIKGYQTCWLKKKSGSFRPKVFYCGRKS